MASTAVDNVACSVNECEPFTVYFEGKRLQVDYKRKINDNDSNTRIPVLRLCCLADSKLILLMADNSLYSANLFKKNLLELELVRLDIIDVDFCHNTKNLFLVNRDGAVLRQCIANEICETHIWQPASFDIVEISDKGVRISRVCCSSHGTVFVSDNGETYVIGCCGETLSSEPRKIHIYDESKKLLDISAGKEHYIMLIGKSCNSVDDLRLSRDPKISVNSLEKPENLTKHSHMSNILAMKSDFTIHQNHSDQTYIADIDYLICQGYAYLNTEVYTFGLHNKGLFSTEMLNSTHVSKLDNIGACSVSAQLQHSMTRTLDGRLFHWDVNLYSELNAVNNIVPAMISLNDQCHISQEEHKVLKACCGNDYYEILSNVNSPLQSKQNSICNPLLHMRLAKEWLHPVKLLHRAGDFTLSNYCSTRHQSKYYLNQLQSQLNLLINHHSSIQTLQKWQCQSTAALKIMQDILVRWRHILYLLVATLQSLEEYCHFDVVQTDDLLFIRFHREYIELFNCYNQSYCDIYSVDGFSSAAKAIAKLSIPIVELRDEIYLLRIFQLPLQVYPVLIKFMEFLVKSQPQYNEYKIAWTEFARQSCINQELAAHTKEFWSNNESNLRIRSFRHQQRRVILTSTMVPLRLSSGLNKSNTSFILFSDGLCQVSGNTICTYPLCTIWVDIEGETGVRITMPEKSLLLLTRTHEARNVWLDQLQSSIKSALGSTLPDRMSDVRIAEYTYSREHSKFPNVKVCGTWCNAVLNGMCYLEYSNGSVYCGEVIDGVIEGYGKMLIPSTGMYIGNFKAGRFHGHGVYELIGNEKYDGNFYEGLFNGHGIFRTERYVYLGEYQANVRNGYGVLEDLVTGDKYMGMFTENKRAGAGICITSHGDYFEGIFTGDELMGTGLVAFENDCYYIGELSLSGPNGKGEYYMPIKGKVNLDEIMTPTTWEDDYLNFELVGNIMSGTLSGNWQNVRVQSGELMLNRSFLKYSKSIGQHIVNCDLKWRSLFNDLESEVMECTDGGIAGAKQTKTSMNTLQLWNSILIYMKQKRARERFETEHDSIHAQMSNIFESKLLLNMPFSKNEKPNHILGHKNNLETMNKPQSIYLKEASWDSDKLQNTVGVAMSNSGCEGNKDNSFESLLSSETTLKAESSISDTNNQNNVSTYRRNSCANAISNTIGLESIPNFGMTSPLSERDLNSIRLYLELAFNDQYHPLNKLKERIGHCFHYSYGYWKVKPTPILAKQAMDEWKSISKRVYEFIRKMFPALPEEKRQLQDHHKLDSYNTFLYPFVLSEEIYSTLFVLYANKYSLKDEIYRQNLIFVENITNIELVELMGMEYAFIAVMVEERFNEAIQTLRQLQEKFSPKDMLDLCMNCINLLVDAYKQASMDNNIQVNADSMMSLSLLTILRAAVPHLGAELALLDDLMGGKNFEAQMNGLTGYCYTTLKAAYEYITSKNFEKLPKKKQIGKST